MADGAGRRVLLTGASGFVGRQIVAPLRAAGCAVHAVARHPPAGDHGDIAWHAADLLDPAARQALVRSVQADTLIHTAWYVEHGRFWTAPENAQWVEASIALARAFAAAGGRRLLGIGTCAEYDWNLAGEAPWPETRPCRPATPYGVAKRELHRQLIALAGSGGLSVAWARLFLMIGPGEQPGRLLPAVIRALVAGEAARCGSGRPVRDFATTPWLGRALAALALSPCEGAVNVASGEGRSIRSVVELAGRLSGRPDLVQLGALPDRPDDIPFMVADIGRLRREAGFADSDDLAAEIARLIAQARQSGATETGSITDG